MPQFSTANNIVFISYNSFVHFADLFFPRFLVLLFCLVSALGLGDLVSVALFAMSDGIQLIHKRHGMSFSFIVGLFLCFITGMLAKELCKNGLGAMEFALSDGNGSRYLTFVFVATGILPLPCIHKVSSP